ncbi:N-succinyldiaminopimelate aminotransferase [Streptomyces sp. Ag109_G2-6]|nr:N-succinyldiaminopimelate aminotransferase [Streptomyces sp. Ag109_G2-6]
MLDDDVRPNRLQDVAWLREYQHRGSPVGDPLMLALGETWDHTPKALLDALREVPPHTHGYQMSMYGLPLLRRLMKRYVAESQRLPESGTWELAVSWTGTRSAMRDFASYVDGQAQAGQPTALVVAPAWDYAGFLEPLGYRMAYVETAASDSFIPSIDEIRATAEAVDELTLVVINAQHNPTGNNWEPEIVRSLVDVALARGAAILVDDAYFGVCPEGVTPTSATAVLLEALADTGQIVPWVSVRSFGKQFHCNGWAIGSLVAEPGFLDDFVNETRPQHTYNYGTHLQYAMAQWLADGPAVNEYLRRESSELEVKRAFVAEAFGNRPNGGVIAGPAAPYALFPVPDEFLGNEQEYLRRCAVRAGVFLSPTWPLARVSQLSGNGFVRMYLGPDLAVLTEALERLGKAGLFPR